MQTYYAGAPAQDLDRRGEDVLVARAQRHRELAQRRERGETLITTVDEESRTVVLIVADDVPYLVSTLNARIAGDWGGARLVVHPILRATRDDDGQLRSVDELEDIRAISSGDTQAIPVVGGLGETSAAESWIQVELAEHLDEDRAQELIEALRPALSTVARIDADHDDMVRWVGSVNDSLSPMRSQLDDVEPAQEFLSWLLGGRFVLMGVKEYDLSEDDEGLYLSSVEGSGLGILTEPQDKAGRPRRLTVQAAEHARDRQAMFVTKANTRSGLHRNDYLDYIGVRRFDADGQVDGEYLILGLFARKAYSTSARNTPWVRDKVRAVAESFGFRPDSHSERDLQSVLEEYPRDELLHMSVEEAVQAARGVLELDERRVTRVFSRTDLFGRFVSAVVYLPRDRYNTEVRQRISDILTEAYGAVDVDFDVSLSTSSLARLFFRLRLPQDTPPPVDHEDLQLKVRKAARSWPEALSMEIEELFDSERAREYVQRWAEAFPADYRARYEIDEAIEDLRRCEMLWGRDEALPAEVRVAPSTAEGEPVRVNVYLTRSLTLTEMLPMEQNLGLTVLDQKPYQVRTGDGREFQLYDFGVELPDGVDAVGPDDARTEDLIEEILCAVISGRSESDTLDRLVLAERMHWRSIAVLRAYVKYLLQLRVPHSFEFMSDTLLAQPQVTRGIVELFETSFEPERFDDDESRQAAREKVLEQLEAALDEVPSLDADRFLRTLVEVVSATARTNAYQEDRPAIALKLEPRRISAAPLPRPRHEIWVWSPRVEGTHLRFGPVSRGGLRWSDRREDFRTEVLGLVKAQMVKNSVIIPDGAKGGFFPKQLPDPAQDREAWAAAGEDAYKEFIGSLLDVTDNLVPADDGEDRTVGPQAVVRRDGDDSYLVVAADKGTARFSDTANGISKERGFWLGDAFASGGSVGYDHKAMGITARGAWESVKRHFFELGHDTQTQDFTVVGVGDMSGDVFGNGMLLSEHIKLVAAFDHRDIFLDPDPDPAASFAERKRVFELGRSSWQDYDESVISDGGGVYSRTSKSIPVSDQVREVLGLPEGTTEMAPPELMRAILKAPVDLFYNGGIGTYFKAESESNADVGDKANDAIRVNGADVRVRVIGEGGNLGATQLGRIEAAQNGVLVNTDAIDNSGGVESSDREVNIKILVDRMVAAGELAEQDRAGFIESMTDAVASLVLRTNVAQNITLSVDRWKAGDYTLTYARFMDWLEEHADLDRAIEYLPTDAQLEERAQDVEVAEPLTAPELSVLTAYAKIQLSGELIRSDLADDPWTAQVVQRYFPEAMGERFGEDLQTHPLRREIVGTLVANQMINMGGSTFAYRALEQTSCEPGELATAFLAAVEIFELDPLLQQLAELPADVPTEQWIQMVQDVRRLLDRAVRWLISRGLSQQPVEEIVESFAQIGEVRREGLTFLGAEDAQNADRLYQQALEAEVPEDLARSWSRLLDSYSLLDIVQLARTEAPEQDLEVVGRLYFALFERFGFQALLTRISALPQTSRWEVLARMSMRADAYATLAAMTAKALSAQGETAEQKTEAWVEDNRQSLERVGRTLEEIESGSTGDAATDMASLSVALRSMRSLISG